MERRTLWALVLGLGLASAGAGLVLANDGWSGSNGPTAYGYGDHYDDDLGGLSVPDVGPAFEDSEVLDVDAFADAGGLDGCNGHAAGFGAVDGIGALADIDTHAMSSVRQRQDVDADEDDILLGIALANNGADGISFNALTDRRSTATVSAWVDEETDLDREDVFSGLALGFDADSTDELEALDCVRDLMRDVTKTVTTERKIDLDEDNVLLAIALSNSVGDDIHLNDVADIELDRTAEIDTHQDVDVDRQDAFLALALGAGGDGHL